MPKKNLLFIILLILFLASNIFWGLEFYFSHQKISWYEQLLSRFYPPLPKKISDFSGKVVEKGEDYLVVETPIPVKQFPTPQGDQTEKRLVKVIVTEQTLIKQELPMNESLWQSEQLMGQPGWGMEETEKIISLDEIEINKSVVVNTSDNILAKNEIIATNIRLLNY